MAAVREGEGPLAGFRPLLAAYAELLFARSHVTGAIVMIATLLDPRAFAGGLVAVSTSLVACRALGLRTGELPFGANALLVGLGVAHTFAPGVATTALLVAASAGSVLLVAALSSLLSRAAMPVLSAAFVVVFPLALAVGTTTGIPVRTLLQDAPFGVPCLPLEALGAILFLPRWDAGVLVLLALVTSSRFAGTLALVGLLTAGLVSFVAPVPVDRPLALSCGLNALLAAIAIGGIWFVPSTASTLLAAGAALLSVLFTVGTSAALGRVGVPTLIAPFWMATVVVLLALRQRAANVAPVAADFAPGTPEENLRHARMERPRVLPLYGIPMRLPFRGAWTCTQAVDGEHTHQGDWRHAFDFEVRGEDGELFSGDGATAESHHCFRLPVLAAADGTVVHVVDGIADNEPGQQDLAHNWGNLVVVHHGVGLYSLSAHLSRGSVRVHVGQIVRRGDVVALCGSSGRAPRPHLHFQLQATPAVGSPTLPCVFADVVTARGAAEPGGGELVVREHEPATGEVLRALEADPHVASCFALPQGFETTLSGPRGPETLTSTIDLLGRWVLRSDAGAVLYFVRSAEGFVAAEALGPSWSVVHLLRAALGRVPFEAGPAFRDVVPSRWGGGPLRRVLSDFVAPFRASDGVAMTYTLESDAARVVVTGTSDERRGGVPLVRTRCVLVPGAGPVLVEVRRGEGGGAGRVERAEARLQDPPEESEPGEQERRTSRAPWHVAAARKEGKSWTIGGA